MEHAVWFWKSLEWGENFYGGTGVSVEFCQIFDVLVLTYVGLHISTSGKDTFFWNFMYIRRFSYVNWCKRYSCWNQKKILSHGDVYVGSHTQLTQKIFFCNCKKKKDYLWRWCLPEEVYIICAQKAQNPHKHTMTKLTSLPSKAATAAKKKNRKYYRPFLIFLSNSCNRDTVSTVWLPCFSVFTINVIATRRHANRWCLDNSIFF